MDACPPPMDPEVTQALVELRRAAGTQLDPEVVEELSAVVGQQPEQLAPTGPAGAGTASAPPPSPRPQSSRA
jgi:hypothetical protein